MSTFLRFACGIAFSGACIGFATTGLAKSSKFKEVTMANEPSVSGNATDGLNARKFAPQPLQMFISLNSQTMSVYRGLTRIQTSRISSGKKGNETPRGIFSVLEKKKYHESNLYNNAPMPYMQRLTWSGIALHQGRVPNYPASHGCIRLPRKVAASLFKRSKYRDHVIIAFEEITPRAVDHPTLFQPRIDLQAAFSLRGTQDDLSYSIGAQHLPNSDEPLRIYITRKSSYTLTKSAQEMLNTLGFYKGKVDGVMGKETIAAINQFQTNYDLEKSNYPDIKTLALLAKTTFREKPKSGHMYVRQKHLPIFDFPVEIKQAQKPLGSHLFVTYNFSKLDTKWIGSTVSTRITNSMRRVHGLDKSSKKRVRGSMKDALSRVVISNEARQKIEKLLSAGSSIAISDNGFGRQTGKGTDFIVETH